MARPGSSTGNKPRNCSAACTRLPLVAYGAAAYLMMSWVWPGLWVGKTGFFPLLHPLGCLVLGFFSVLGFIWAILVWHDEMAILRFMISGALPLLFPWSLQWVLEWLPLNWFM